MKRFFLVALSILLLLAVAAPNCLAAENRTSDQQPAPHYSNLQPLQFTDNHLTQKAYFQAALWLAQQKSRQASPPHADDEWLGLNTTKATVLSSLATLLTAIMAPIISIFVARRTMGQTKKSLEDDFNQRKLEQKENFKFQLYQLALEEKKKVMLNFFESTAISRVQANNFSMENLKTQLTMIEMLMDKKFYNVSLRLFEFLNHNIPENILKLHNSKHNPNTVTTYKELHIDLANEIRRVLRGEDFDPTLTASK